MICVGVTCGICSSGRGGSGVAAVLFSSSKGVEVRFASSAGSSEGNGCALASIEGAASVGEEGGCSGGEGSSSSQGAVSKGEGDVW